MPNWKFEWFDRVDLVGEALLGESPNTTTHVNLSSPPFNVIFRSFTGAAPPFTPINENVPLTPGSYLKFVHTQENEVDLVLLINASSRQELYNIMAGSATNGIRLSSIFNPVKADVKSTLLDPPAGADDQRLLTGFGKLRVTTPAVTPDGSITRDLICRCISGFQIREADLQIKSAFCPLTFYANNPYWRSSTRNIVILGPQGFPPTPQPPIPPDPEVPMWFSYLDNINMGAGAKYEKNFYINNFGDVSAPPIWTVTGPGAAPYFCNLTTGKTLQFNRCIIGKKQNLVIDVENRTAKISKGPNVMNTINVSSEFWELMTGTNKITVRLFDGPPVEEPKKQVKVTKATNVKLEYYERFMGVY